VEGPRAAAAAPPAPTDASVWPSGGTIVSMIGDLDGLIAGLIVGSIVHLPRI